jgi:hypothetical protein
MFLHKTGFADALKSQTGQSAHACSLRCNTSTYHTEKQVYIANRVKVRSTRYLSKKAPILQQATQSHEALVPLYTYKE